MSSGSVHDSIDDSTTYSSPHSTCIHISIQTPRFSMCDTYDGARSTLSESMGHSQFGINHEKKKNISQ